MLRLFLLVTFLLFDGLMVSPVHASTGNPIFFIKGDPEPVNFSWSIPQSHVNFVVVINNPRGREVFFVYNKTQTNLASAYRDRVKNLTFDHGNVSFALKSVSKEDEGNYTCHEGDDLFGPVIPDCGQTLHYLSRPEVKINSSKDVTGAPGENLTLKCLVGSPSPDVPSQAYSWTFIPAGSNSLEDLKETGNTLTLGPLTTNSSGQYTCQARNDQDFKGLIPPGNATIFLKVHSQEDSGHHGTPPTSLPAASSSVNTLAVGLGVGLSVAFILAVLVFVMAKRRQMCCFEPPGGVSQPVELNEGP